MVYRPAEILGNINLPALSEKVVLSVFKRVIVAPGTFFLKAVVITPDREVVPCPTTPAERKMIRKKVLKSLIILERFFWFGKNGKEIPDIIANLSKIRQVV